MRKNAHKNVEIVQHFLDVSLAVETKYWQKYPVNRDTRPLFLRPLYLGHCQQRPSDLKFAFLTTHG